MRNVMRVSVLSGWCEVPKGGGKLGEVFGLGGVVCQGRFSTSLEEKELEYQGAEVFLQSK